MRYRLPAALIAVTIAAPLGGVLPARASAPAPSVTSLSVSSGRTAGGQAVTVHGVDLDGVRSVTFGTVQATGLRHLSASALAVTTPALEAGHIIVRLHSSAGTSRATAGSRFAFLAPPAVSALSAVTGPPVGGGLITVRGTSFRSVRAVTFGQTAAPGWKVLSPTTIHVRLPAHDAGVAYLRVVGDYGTSLGVPASRYVYAVPGPSPVQDLAVADTTATSVRLTWRPPADGGQVVVRRALGDTAPASVSDGDAVASLPAGSTSVVDTHLVAATTYSYALFGAHSDGTSSAASTVTTPTAASPRPAAPTDLFVSGLPAGQDCTTGTGLLARQFRLVFGARLNDPDGIGARLDFVPFLLDYGLSGTASPVNLLPDTDRSSSVAAGDTADVFESADDLQDGHTYAVGGHAVTDDSSSFVSAASLQCRFRMDLQAPSGPTVVSSSFDPPGVHVGASGTVVVQSSDLAPTGAEASGIDHFNYAFGSASYLPSGTHIAAVGSGATRSAAITSTPTVWGTNYLYVQAVDRAGNVSPTLSYSFYVLS